jgi:hypothetical protein
MTADERAAKENDGRKGTCVSDQLKLNTQEGTMIAGGNDDRLVDKRLSLAWMVTQQTH